MTHPSDSAREKLYFAYGSNLNETDLKCWGDRKGIKLPEALLSEPVVGYLPDMELMFDYFSTSRKGGALNIRERVGQVIPGVIFKVAAGGWEILDKKEGAPDYYESIECHALTLDGAQVPVTTYRVVEHRRCDYVEPTDDYLNVVRAGYKKFGLDSRALENAARNEEIPFLIDGLFAYGTLMRGESRFQVLKKYGISCALLAELPGRLYDLKGYPGLVLAGEPASSVTGELIRLNDLEQAILVLDRVEGFSGFGKGDSLFRRALVTVGMFDGRIRQAWTYLLEADHKDVPVILSGNWRVARGRWETFTEHLVEAHSGGDERGMYRKVMESQISMSASQPVENRSVDRPLLEALRQFAISERKIAQSSGKWAAMS